MSSSRPAGGESAGRHRSSFSFYPRPIAGAMNKPLDYIFPDPPAGLDPRLLDPDRVPQHVAVQRPLGEEARAQPPAWAQGRHRGGARDDPLRLRRGGALPDHLLVLHRELEASRRRGRGADGPVRQDDARRGRRPRRGERARAHHRRPVASARGDARGVRGGLGADARQHRHDARRRRELRRAPGDPARGRRPAPSGGARGIRRCR